MSVLVNTQDLDRFIRDLNGAHQRVILRSLNWMSRLTNYTRRRMRIHATSRTARSTGKLANSVTSEVSIQGQGVHGVIYPAGSLPYKFAAEKGRKGGRIIRARGSVMAFPLSSWKKGRSNLNITKLANNGIFYFTQIRTGKYKGKQYVEKAFNNLQTYYKSKESIIIRQLGNVVLFSRSTG